MKYLIINAALFQPDHIYELSAFLFTIQHQVALIPLKHVSPGNVIQRPLVPDYIISCDVVPVIDTEQDGFFRLHRHPVDFIPGQLPEIGPSGRKDDSFLCLGCHTCRKRISLSECRFFYPSVS